MLYVMCIREDILHFLPKGGVCGEIGVFEGDFSSRLYEIIEPTELHLIDPWDYLDDEERKETDSNPAESHSKVKARFVASPEVSVHKGFSNDVMATFDDGYFDFIYIDGDHAYNFVYDDLLMAERKLRKGGIIAGHDFFETTMGRERDVGVIDAVNRFCQRSPFNLIMLNNEIHGSFFLSAGVSPYVEAFLNNAINSEQRMIEVNDIMAASYAMKPVPKSTGGVMFLPSFGGKLIKSSK